MIAMLPMAKLVLVVRLVIAPVSISLLSSSNQPTPFQARISVTIPGDEHNRLVCLTVEESLAKGSPLKVCWDHIGKMAPLARNLGAPILFPGTYFIQAELTQVLDNGATIKRYSNRLLMQVAETKGDR